MRQCFSKYSDTKGSVPPGVKCRTTSWEKVRGRYEKGEMVKNQTRTDTQTSFQMNLDSISTYSNFSSTKTEDMFNTDEINAAVKLQNFKFPF